MPHYPQANQPSPTAVRLPYSSGPRARLQAAPIHRVLTANNHFDGSAPKSSPSVASPSTIAITPFRSTKRSATLKLLSQTPALAPTSCRPCQIIKAARSAKLPLRARVGQPIGRELNWPKHWQSGLRPRARFTAIAALKSVRRTRAVIDPAQAVEVKNKARAVASSAAGSKNARLRERRSGTPKSRIAWRDRSRSRSFAIPAAANTAAKKRRTTSRDISTTLYRMADPLRQGSPDRTCADGVAVPVSVTSSILRVDHKV